MDAAKDGDAQAATASGGGRGKRVEPDREAEGQAAEESRARQVAGLDGRTAALDAYLERESVKGFTVETRSKTQAVIVRNRRRWLPRARQTERRVLSVDENGDVTTRTAEPLRW